jgi:hypothetical protein
VTNLTKTAFTPCRMEEEDDVEERDKEEEGE